MRDFKAIRVPVDYIYLDGPGIESLHAQLVDTVETSRTMTTQKGTTTKVGAGLRLKNFLLKLTGLEGEVSAEMTGSRARTEQSTGVQTIEHRLQRVIDFLTTSGKGYFFTSLREAGQHLLNTDGSVFINVRDMFNAPQFYLDGVGTHSVNDDGYLLLEKGGDGDYCDRDDYYKQSTAVVKLSASIKKIRSGSGMGLTSHEAIFFRGFQGRNIPLSVFGILSGTPDYLQIKPFAIWK
jgi:hypothetical protein